MDSQDIINEIELLVRSKRTVLYVVTQEENRVISALEQMTLPKVSTKRTGTF